MSATARRGAARADRASGDRASGAPPDLLTPSVLGVVARLGALHPELGALAPRDALSSQVARAIELGVLEGDDVTLAWELARLVEGDARGEVMTLALSVLEAARRGSTRVPLVAGSDRGPSDRARAGSEERGQLALPFVQPVAPRELPSLVVGAYDTGAPLVRTGEGSASWLALRRWAASERAIARDLARRAAPSSGLEIEGALAWVHALRTAPLAGGRGAMHLTAEQEDAVAAMAAERTVVLTGGPGTGKTSVVVSLLRVLAHRAHGEGGLGRLADEVRLVALAAPTGKAADRLGDAVRSALARSDDPRDAALAAALTPPSTLHRLLGYRRGVGEGSFRAHRHDALAQRVIVLDEVSMIDTWLFERLLAAVSPEAALVLLGDPDQLPSVDPGAILRDLLAARPRGVRVQALTRSHRMDPADAHGSQVLSVARACRAGEPLERVPFRRGPDASIGGAPGQPDASRVLDGGAWHLEARALPWLLDAWIARHLTVDVLAPLGAVDADESAPVPPVVLSALQHLARARILTVTRRTAQDLDAYVSAAMARFRGEPVRSRRLLPGEPVLAVQNDYDEDLWNGDSGVVWRDRRGELQVSFARGQGARTRPLAAVAHLVERSHAVTVHKAQGSEHDEVLFVLPPTDTALSSREIVYTAITRARRTAVVVGRAELLSAALARTGERETGLVDALRDPR
ncbi:MAG: AAA family ATPase [Sandaracinaceae bacterium]|nr:AAA family ATPase [Sandaracinaceae bacterium]